MSTRPGLRPERWILGLALALSGCGLLALASAGVESGGLESHLVRQAIWTGLGVLLFLAVRTFDSRQVLEMSRGLAGFAVLGLVLVLLLGHERGESRRWFALGPLQWTPSEFGKVALVLVTARELMERKDNGEPGWERALAWTGLFFILILSQPELGRAGFLLPVAACLLWAAGTPAKVFGVSAGFIAAALPLGYGFLMDYQRKRILTFLNPEMDSTGSGYNLSQSKIAIGAGGLLGEGWRRGSQTQFQFIPEKHTDFIFSVIGEEWGFLGCFLIALLLFAMMAVGLHYAREARDEGGSLMAVGLTLMVTLEGLVNMAMTVGLLPVTGLPLPLVSYGGSSVLMGYAALGLVSRIGAEGSVTQRWTGGSL